MRINLRGSHWTPRACPGRDSVSSPETGSCRILGNDAKRHHRPVRDDRNIGFRISRASQRLRHPRSSRPGRIVFFKDVHRAASAGSSGQANPQALIGQSPLAFLLFAICLGLQPARDSRLCKKRLSWSVKVNSL
jgi:hypothetical protein